MKIFGISWLSLLLLWALCVLALGATQSACLYEEDRRDTDGLMNQDGDVMDEADPSSQDLVTVFEDDDRGGDADIDSFDDGLDDDEDRNLDENVSNVDDRSEEEDTDGHVKDSSSHRRTLCLDKECVIAAGRMISMMNQSANPCEDFYNYACGNFKMTHEPFEDMTRTMSFEMLRRENNFILHNVLRQRPRSTGLTATDNVKNFYDSCMKLESGGDESFIKAIIKKYGPWPMDSKNWNAKKWNFNKVLNDVSTLLPVTPLFSLIVALDKINPDVHIFQLDQSGLGVPSAYYLSMDKQKRKVRKAYIKLMKDVMKLMGYGSKSQIADLIDVYLFEKKLAKIFLSLTVLREPENIYKRVSIKYLQRISPEILWGKVFETRVKLVGLKKRDIKLIAVRGLGYFKNLAKVLRQTSKRTLANYLLWKIVSALSPVGGKKYRVLNFLFSQVSSGKKAMSPLWNDCILYAANALPFAFGRLYVDTRFKSKFAVKESRRMVKEIKTEFASNLKNVKWMSDETKKKARDKARAIKDLVAYPDFILDDNRLNKEYEGLKLDRNGYLGNLLKVHMFNLKKQTRLLSKPRKRSKWNDGPSIVNAFYSQVYNRIVFPAGILQPLFYHHSYPRAMKYGSIGTVIGHEITHAFDDKGRKFDKTGRLHQWWNEADIKKFEKRADCIRNQYSSYSIYGAHMNGKLSSGENIADNGGVKMSYKAFRRQLLKNPKTKALPGLQHLSDDQLFFVSFAKLWCIIEEKARTLKNIVTDPHSFPKFRVIGALTNSKEFARAFNCKDGSKMNPAKKCTIW